MRPTVQEKMKMCLLMGLDVCIELLPQLAIWTSTFLFST